MRSLAIQAPHNDSPVTVSNPQFSCAACHCHAFASVASASASVAQTHSHHPSSTIHGHHPPSFRLSIHRSRFQVPISTLLFLSLISLVIHPKNPLLTSFHPRNCHSSPSTDTLSPSFHSSFCLNSIRLDPNPDTQRGLCFEQLHSSTAVPPSHILLPKSLPIDSTQLYLGRCPSSYTTELAPSCPHTPHKPSESSSSHLHIIRCYLPFQYAFLLSLKWPFVQYRDRKISSL